LRCAIGGQRDADVRNAGLDRKDCVSLGFQSISTRRIEAFDIDHRSHGAARQLQRTNAIRDPSGQCAAQVPGSISVRSGCNLSHRAGP
jgi:hypothetical protein